MIVLASAKGVPVPLPDITREKVMNIFGVTLQVTWSSRPCRHMHRASSSRSLYALWVLRAQMVPNPALHIQQLSLQQLLWYACCMPPCRGGVWPRPTIRLVRSRNKVTRMGRLHVYCLIFSRLCWCGRTGPVSFFNVFYFWDQRFLHLCSKQLPRANEVFRFNGSTYTFYP